MFNSISQWTKTCAQGKCTCGFPHVGQEAGGQFLPGVCLNLGSLLFVLHEVRLDKIVTQKKLPGSRKEARYVRGRLKSVAGIVIETFESLALSTSHYTVTRGFPLINSWPKSEQRPLIWRASYQYQYPADPAPNSVGLPLMMRPAQQYPSTQPAPRRQPKFLSLNSWPKSEQRPHSAVSQPVFRAQPRGVRHGHWWGGAWRLPPCCHHAPQDLHLRHRSQKELHLRRRMIEGVSP